MPTPTAFTSRIASTLAALSLVALAGCERAIPSAHADPAPAPVATWRSDFEAQVRRAASGHRAHVEALTMHRAATVAEMQMAVAGAVGGTISQAVVLEETRCEGADCASAFEREVAALDASLAACASEVSSRLAGDVSDLRVTAWRVEAGGGVAREAVSIQGLRDGRVAAVVVYR